MSTFREREQRKKQLKRRTAVSSFAYIVIIIVAAFFLSAFIMNQVDLYDLLGLRGLEIPVINVPGTDIPRWVLQLVLGVLIFFILQTLVYIVAALLGVGKEEDKYARPHKNPWES